MKPGLGIEEIGKMADCLHDRYNVDPDDVIKFSDKAQKVLNYNFDKLMQIAPGIASYAEVPEFGSMTILIISISIVGAILFSRKYVQY